MSALSITAFAALTIGLVPALAQTGQPVPALNSRIAHAAIPQPPVPNDPLELVTGSARPVEDAAQRADALHLLTAARALSNVRANPYDLKTTFNAVGSSSSDGAWQMEDSSPGRGVYRWTAQGPSYSAVNLYVNRLLYSNQLTASIPLRLAQVRAAIFFNQREFGSHAAVRTFASSLNDVQVTCVLVARMFFGKPGPGARRWDEEESCVDSKSGLLLTYSPVPGLYVLYDYSQALHFNDKIIPAKFTITQAAQPIIDARIESISKPASAEDPIFATAGLTAIGTGMLMRPPSNVHIILDTNAAIGNSAAQLVVLHGMMSSDGHFGDAEIVASSDASLNQQAMSHATQFQTRQSEDGGQPGATPQSHEVFVTVEFVKSGS